MNQVDWSAEKILVDRAMLEDIHDDLCDLVAAWQWKKDEPRSGHDKAYERLVERAKVIGEMIGLRG